MLEGMENNTSKTPFFSFFDYLKITLLGFAIAALANAMHSIILPIRIEEMVGSSQKSTFLGLLTFAGLVVAMLLQPVVGTISDRSSLRIGKRKPFIIIGITLGILLLFGTGWANSYIALLVLWCLLQASMNTAQGPFQAYIPDLVPRHRTGLASGVKNLVEIGGGVALLSLIGSLMANYSGGQGQQWLWLSLGILGLALLGTLIFTVFSVKERVPAKQPLRWSSVIPDSFKINIRSNSSFWFFLISRLLFLMSLTTLQTFALYYFKDVVGAENPAKITGDLVTVVGIAMLIIVYPAGRFSDKIGRRLILTLCGLIGALGIVIIYFMHSYSWVLVAGALIGLGAGAFLSVNWALATDLIPTGQSARYLGLTNLASTGGGALARLIGPLIDFFNGFSTNLGYSIMLGTCFVYFLLASALTWKIK
jgi:Na+/melibiose symporter-like transporter